MASGTGSVHILPSRPFPSIAWRRSRSRPRISRRPKIWTKKFLHEVGLDRRCVVLTGTPNSDLNSVGIAGQLAVALKTRSIFPPADGLATLEGGHLNSASAERWSGQLVEA